MTDYYDSFLLRVAFETLVQADRDRVHPNASIRQEAELYLRSEMAGLMREALIGRSVWWSPLAGLGRGKKSGRRLRRAHSSLKGDTAR